MTATPTKGGTVVSAAIVGGSLLIGLSSGAVIDCGLVQGPRGLKGEPGPPGATGAAGADGNTILHGAGPPPLGIGKEGDFYLDTAELRWYGPKVGGKWPPGVDLLAAGKAERRSGRNAPNSPWSTGRMGPAFFGGTGPTGAVQQQVTQGLAPILIHGNPLPVNTPAKIAEDTGGPLFEVELRAESAAGVWVGSVRVASFGAAVSHTVFGEILLGTAPVLTFTPTLNGTTLGLSMSSNVALTKVEGVQILLRQ